MKKKFALLLSCLFLLAACNREEARPGEVALVNGVPITLRQLQAAHDALVIGGDGPGRTLEALRAEYGEALSELIVQELVVQELAERKLSVTDEELAQSELEFRQDYPPGGFERMLLEESIDLDLWRNALRKRLSVAKFNSRVLRPQVSINADEVEEYYKEHEDEFKIPERLHFIQFSSLSREQAAAAAALFAKEKNTEAIQARFPNMNIRMVVMREDRLDPQVVKILERLKPDEVAPPVELNGEYVGLVLLGKEAAHLLAREKIYSRIQAMLLEDKIQEAFRVWLEKKIAKSDIRVSVHLLPANLR